MIGYTQKYFINIRLNTTERLNSKLYTYIVYIYFPVSYDGEKTSFDS